MPRPRRFHKLRLESKVGYQESITWPEKIRWVLKHRFPWQPDGPVTFEHAVIPLGFRADLRIVSVGDLLFQGRDYRLDAFLPEWQRRFAGAFKIGNLETPLALSRPPTPPRSIIRFNASPTFWNQLRTMEFDVLSVANNHIFDMGEVGLRETCEVLRREGILPVGTRYVTEDVREHAGKRLGFLAYTFGTNREPENKSVRRFPFFRADVNERKEEVMAAIREMRGRCDFLVLMLHWGYECETRTDPGVRGFAREFVEAGTDLLLGHHPHVVQPEEKVVRADGGEALVVYSQGNFFSISAAPLTRTGHVFDIHVRFEYGRPRFAWTVHRTYIRRFSAVTRFVDA